MKKILYLLIVVAAFGCKNGEKATTGNSDSSKSKTEDTQDLSNFTMSFSKTPCFGPCPVYDVTIDGQGKMSFFGRRFVSPEGHHDFTVDKGFIKEVLSRAESINFYELDKLYDQNVTDLPSTVTMISYDGKTNKVRARAGIPEDLKAFNLWIHNELMKVVKANSSDDSQGSDNQLINPEKPKTGEAKPAKPPVNSR